jgi:hypothetical protein
MAAPGNTAPEESVVTPATAAVVWQIPVTANFRATNANVRTRKPFLRRRQQYNSDLPGVHLFSQRSPSPAYREAVACLGEL